MHDTHLLKYILKYFKEQEELNSRKLKKVYLSMSEFGSLKKEHFLEHFQKAVSGTGFDGVEIKFETVPFGPELEITGLEFKSRKEE